VIRVLKIYFPFFYVHGILLKGFTTHVVVDVPNRVLIYAQLRDPTFKVTCLELRTHFLASHAFIISFSLILSLITHKTISIVSIIENISITELDILVQIQGRKPKFETILPRLEIWPSGYFPV
jgi:hypothetical protein